LIYRKIGSADAAEPLNAIHSSCKGECRSNAANPQMRCSLHDKANFAACD